MYTDENSDKDSENEDKNSEDSPNITKKSISTLGFRNNPENQNARPLALRATQSFTGALDEYRFCNNFQRLNVCNRNVGVPKITPMCPCGCLLKPPVTGPFRTREKDTLALYVVSPEVLNYHGYNFDPNQIALLWKKDCRMFLWKGKSKSKKSLHIDSHK